VKSGGNLEASPNSGGMAQSPLPPRGDATGTDILVYRAVLQQLESSVNSDVKRSGRWRRLAGGVVGTDGRRGSDDGRSGGTEILQSERRRTAAATQRHDCRAAAAETQPGNIIIIIIIISFNSATASCLS